MDYSALLWSIACGWWFFGTLPADTTWVGAPLIVASGLFIAWREHREELVRAWADPPQTNEVARSAVLLPALLHLSARHPGLPLTLLEIGSSAGLNLWPDGWRYDFGTWSWGQDDAPLVLASLGLSNLVSNVPAVMLLLPHLSTPQAGVTLALVSTLAGNLLLVGSIANLIVVDLAKRNGIDIEWAAHARIGLPITVVTTGLVWFWLA